MKSACPSASVQTGSALIVGLIMLVLLTLFAFSTFNMGKSSLEIVGNMQQSNTAVQTANNAIQEVLSTTRMFQQPTNVFLTPCTAANTRCYDTNGDGTNSFIVTVAPPACIEARTVQNSELVLNRSTDAGCSVGTQQNFGIEGAATGASLCSNSLWEISATSTNSATQTTATVTEGATVRVSTATVSTFCP